MAITLVGCLDSRWQIKQLRYPFGLPTSHANRRCEHTSRPGFIVRFPFKIPKTGKIRAVEAESEESDSFC